MKGKRRGRKKVCDSEPSSQVGGYKQDSIDVTNDKKLDFGETTKSNDEVVSFGNLNIGVIKINAPKHVTESNIKISPEHSLCEIIIPEDANKEQEKNLDPGISGEYRAEEDYLLNIPNFKKKRKYLHKSVNFGEDVFPLFEEMSELVSFPLEKKTNIHCWWCCHRFDCTPRVLPTKFENKKSKFTYTGNFCSWACVRSFMMNDISLKSINNQSLLSLFIFKIYNKLYSGKAPPRQFLKIFGGNMSIHDFREASEKFEYTKIRNISAILDRNIYLYYKC
jgi:hypothetical protein